MPTLTHLMSLTQLTRCLPFGADYWPTTPQTEYLVDNGAGLWEPYLVVQADLTGWQMYEVESQ